MRHLPDGIHDDNILVGLDHADDGSVYRLTDDLALIQTLDFFTPIVDDPYAFGQISAANALSDVYAMGGTPLTVLNIVAFPIDLLGPNVLAKILKGSADKVAESGAQVVGGHSIDDKEPKFGLSVTGTVHPDKYFKNKGAHLGDKLILTKPIGVGIQTTALKKGLLTDDQVKQVTETMSMLNRPAAEALKKYHPHAVTDVTGFGLLGHAYEMASGSNVSFTIELDQVPLLPGTRALAKQNIMPGGSRENHAWLKDKVSFADTRISEVDQLILSDSITSGGLLISLSEDEAISYVEDMKKHYNIEATIIGEVVSRSTKTIYVT